MKGRNLKAFIIMVLPMMFTGLAGATPVESKNLSFQYIPNEYGAIMDCVHSKIRDLPDWEVICGKGTPQQKKYSVHFVTKEYQRAVQPVTTFEYLYWVTEWEFVKPVYSSNSFWLRLKEKSSIHGIRLYQGVENDVASLVLDYTP